MAERVADMPPMPGVGMATAEPREKPAIDDVLVTPVHEGGADDWSRFEGASAAIGYFLRLVHEGRISMDEGWTAICGYNAAMLRPSWPLDRLKRETNRLWELHIKRHGPPLIRLDSAAPSADRPADLHSRRAARRHEPDARRHHRPARADAGRAAGAGRRAQGRQERPADRIAGAHGGGRALPRLHPAAAAADLLPAGRDPVPLPARAHAADRPAARADRRRARQPDRHAEAAHAARCRGQRPRGRGDQGRVPRRAARHPLHRPDPEPLRRRARRRWRERQRRDDVLPEGPGRGAARPRQSRTAA